MASSVLQDLFLIRVEYDGVGLGASDCQSYLLLGAFQQLRAIDGKSSSKAEAEG